MSLILSLELRISPAVPVCHEFPWAASHKDSGHNMLLHTQGLPGVERFLFEFNFFSTTPLTLRENYRARALSSLSSGFSAVFKTSQRTIIVYAVRVPHVFFPPFFPPSPLSLITRCQKNTTFVHSEGTWLRSRCVCILFHTPAQSNQG